jgi:phosphoglycolate phosphatase
VPRLLVLWDVDHTLVNAGGVGIELYRIAFAEMFGGEPPVPGSMAGRTDRAIAVEVLTLAGVPEPRRQIAAFQAIMAAHAPELTGLLRARGRALPGAAEALAALAMRDASDSGDADHTGNDDYAANAVSGDDVAGRPDRADGRADGRAARAGHTDGRAGLVVQSLLTGNIRPLAEVKLGALGLTGHLDLDVGAYGDAHEVRSELVGPARRRAALAYGAEFGGPATVLVGDTPLDIEAAIVTGARAVGVATGGFSMAELARAGANAVLPDLTDTSRVLAAILGPPGTLPLS